MDEALKKQLRSAADVLENFPDLLKLTKLERGLTYEQLVDETGVARSTLAAIMAGEVGRMTAVRVVALLRWMGAVTPHGACDQETAGTDSGPCGTTTY